MAEEQDTYRSLADVMMEQPQTGQRLSNRQVRMLLSLLRLSHPKVARWSSWSILSSPRWPRKPSPMVSFDTALYEKLVELQEEELRQQQQRQHRIWQHVQDRVAQQQKLLEEEEMAAATSPTQEPTSAATTSTPSSSTNKDTNAAVQALFADLNAELTTAASSVNSKSSLSSNVLALKDPSTFQKSKRSIRWGLQNNTIRRFDKNIPLKDVKLPPMDRRPIKSALKLRTPNGIQKPSATSNSKYFPPRKTAADFF